MSVVQHSSRFTCIYVFFFRVIVNGRAKKKWVEAYRVTCRHAKGVYLATAAVVSGFCTSFCPLYSTFVLNFIACTPHSFSHMHTLHTCIYGVHILSQPLRLYPGYILTEIYCIFFFYHTPHIPLSAAIVAQV